MDNIDDKENLMATKEAHIEKIEEQLKQRGAKLDELVAKANEAGPEVKSDYHRRIDDLKAKFEIMRSKQAELKAASNDKWQTVKTGVETAWKELEATFNNLTN